MWEDARISESKNFFQNVCLLEVQKERKTEYGSFPLIFFFTGCYLRFLKVSLGSIYSVFKKELGY